MNRTMCLSLALAGTLVALPLHAASPQDLIADYATEAARTQQGFVASAERAERLLGWKAERDLRRIVQDAHAWLTRSARSAST